jgi:hypothetical protein
MSEVAVVMPERESAPLRAPMAKYYNVNWAQSTRRWIMQRKFTRREFLLCRAKDLLSGREDNL